MLAVPTSAATWFVCFAWVCSCLADGFTPSGELFTKLKTLKAGYEAYLLKNATTPFQESLEALNAKAMTALERESDAAAQRKDLEALARLKEDMERLKKGEILTKSTAETPKASPAVYATYQREFARIESALKASKADAAGKYDMGLKQLQDQLTALKEVDAALHVKSIRDDLVKNRTQEPSLIASQPENSKSPNAQPVILLDENMPRKWSYLIQPEGAARGSVVFTPDGKAEFTGMHKNPDTGAWEQKITPGTWTKGKKLNQLIITFPDYSWDVRIENGVGKMETDIGVRYLKPTS
jgi:hypothetical protein